MSISSTTTMSSLPPVTKYDLTRLPMEIRVEILCHLPNLHTLLSAILTHSSIYDTYKQYSRNISLVVFRQRCRAIEGYNISEVLGT
ncbi:hypothetical protein HD806DRAFT_487583 [Xylariaceae sp. AK1471]|nr:hypothetical protein HD806DRAFT_487583 [Xylariaceae sp. AK1471]